MKVASLTSALLSTKGSAAPTAKTPAPEATHPESTHVDVTHPDVARNVEFLHKPLRPQSAVVDAAAPRVARPGVTRVSLRLQTTRHMRLRLAAAHLGRSNQALMLSAIDYYIDNVLPPLLANHCACAEQGWAPEGTCCGALGLGRTHPNAHPDYPQ